MSKWRKPRAAATLHEAAAHSTVVHVVYSAICFEYFVLLHFARTTRAFRDGEQMLKEVKKHLPD